ncbi:MAG: hypothetical protein IPH80_02695 [Myxococcales bacterium]|nr:hypothetical protein [Myxococcales bacterium]
MATRQLQRTYRVAAGIDGLVGLSVHAAEQMTAIATRISRAHGLAGGLNPHRRVALRGIAAR